MLFNNEIIQSDNLFNFFTSICYYKIVLLSLLGTFYCTFVNDVRQKKLKINT